MDLEEIHSFGVSHHQNCKVVTVEEHKPGAEIVVVAVVVVVVVVAEVYGVHPRTFRTHFLVVVVVAVAVGDGDDVVAVERNIPASVYRAFRCWGCKWGRRLRRSSRPDNLGMKCRDLRPFWTGTWPRIEQRGQPQLWERVACKV